MGLYRPAQGYTNSLVVAQVLAATATSEFSIFAAPCPSRVIGVRVVPDVATTGDNTNTKNLNVLYKGGAGVGTTVIGNKNLVTGVNLVAFDEMVVPFNATYANGRDMVEGDTLTLQVEKVGTGVIVGGFLVLVDWTPL